MIISSTQNRALALAGSFAAALLVGALSTAAQAATLTYNFTNGGVESGDGFGNAWTFAASDGSTVKVTGYNNRDLDNINSKFTSNEVGRWNEGLGVWAKPSDGEHTVDNSGYGNLLVFEFSQAVRVDKVRLNAYGDTDIAVWSGTPNGNPVFTNLAFNTLSSVLNYNGVNTGSDDNRTATLAGMSFAKFLVVAANPSQDNDSFKIGWLDVTTAPIATPLPAAAPMLASALGLGGFAAWRRRRTQLATAAAA